MGEEFDAYVSAVVSFGLFITLEDVYADGLLPMDALGDDWYRYEDVEHRLVGESTGRVYRLGDRLRVKLVRADFDKRLLDFQLVGVPRAPREAAEPAPVWRYAKPEARPARGREEVEKRAPARGPKREQAPRDDRKPPRGAPRRRRR